jgi:outer membrane protein OmpA-like peptidoglycan-associated protein
MARYFFCACLIILFYSHCCVAQIRVDTSLSAEFLVNEVLLGEGVIAENIQFTGAKHSMGLFADSSQMLSIKKGILLTTGSALVSKGPNKFTDMQFVNRTKGYQKLEALANGRTFDAAVLEFDFVTYAENLSFRFIFASEEYTEYVGSKFNDVFAFFINGPGLNNVNLAVLPKSDIPVTVNTINYKKNKKYYVDNPTANINDHLVYDVQKKRAVKNKNYNKPEALPKYNIQYDGFTTILEAACKVIPGETYHIEIAIADVNDYSLDSGVFLEANTFSSTGEITSKLPPVVNDANVETVPEIITLEDAQFAFNKYDLQDSSFPILNQLAEYLKKYTTLKIEIDGHTDNVGTHEYNYMLSINRAKAVLEYLLAQGIHAERINFQGFGQAQPKENNQTEEGRTKNRRVEIKIIR